eukprot:TRINITY_DN35531_c0_g1_i1.p1 TRINITY_DN35531_c0_g1~~TRINITY_DN35531_c0_g1_i1.p1  ORF type:complete len:622 (+),score=61.25 TRINITY_DN35531_c0_g1_i1:77-1867(+)
MAWKRSGRGGGQRISDEALSLVFGYLEDPRDRHAASLVCKHWYEVDGFTRKHVTVAFCYSTSAEHLTRRFPRLESLKLKGKPRAAMYDLLPDDWGGYASPWINHISFACDCLKSVHLRRMVVSDQDLATLVTARGHMLQSLKLEKCSGFSTRGLLEVAKTCPSLKVLMLDESNIEEKTEEWLHELALSNSSLEVLNFYLTQLQFNEKDIEMIVRNCKSLRSLKVSDIDIMSLKDVLPKATSLEEFGGCAHLTADGQEQIKFPPKLTSLLSPCFMNASQLPALISLAGSLKRLDLQFTELNTESHCQLLERCPNLEILEVTTVIGDKGLEVVANVCKKLRRLRVERGPEEPNLEGSVSQIGVSCIAQGCPLLEYIAIYVLDISNSALETIGQHCQNLRDFRLVLLDKQEHIADLPLDRGVKGLLEGCQKLNRFAFYVRRGALTDRGLYYIGKYSLNVRWMLLGFVGDTDQGILDFSMGCPKLERLEIRGCDFSEAALAGAVLQLRSLRYIWVQGYNASVTGFNLLAMARPYWNIEFSPGSTLLQSAFNNGENEAEFDPKDAPQLLAYYSLAGRRKDLPDSVIPLAPPLWFYPPVAVF